MTRPFIPFVHGAMVRLKYTYQSYDFGFSNVLHFHTAAGFTEAELQTLVNAIIAWDLTDWRHSRNTYVSLSEVYARGLDAPTAAAYAAGAGGGHQGTYGTGIISLATTKCFKLQTPYTGRSYRGRVYVPPLGIIALAAPNMVNTTFVTAVINELTNLKTLVQGLSPSMQWVIASYRTDGAWRTYADWQPVQTITATHLRIDTQRRRAGQRPAI